MMTQTKTLPEGWEMVNLGDVLNFQSGYAFHSSQYVDDGFRIFRITNIGEDGFPDLDSEFKYLHPDQVEDYKRYKLSLGDIVLVMVGASTGKLGRISNSVLPCLLNQNMWRLDVKDERILPQFLFFGLQNFMDTYLLSIQGSARGFIKQKDFKNYSLPLPPLNEQKRIVAKLDALFERIDRAIDLVERSLEEVEALWKCVLSEVFHSGEEELPEGWEMVKLKDVASVLSGSAFPKKYQGSLDQPYPFLKVSDMNTEGNEIEVVASNNYVSELQVSEMKAKLHYGNIVIFPKIGAAIATNKKRKVKGPVLFDNNVMGIQPSERVNFDFLYYFLLGFDLVNWSSTSSLPSMRKSTVQDELIPQPSLSEQKRIVTKLDGIRANQQKLRDYLHARLEKLKNLKKSLLNAAFNGEL